MNTYVKLQTSLAFPRRFTGALTLLLMAMGPSAFASESWPEPRLELSTAAQQALVQAACDTPTASSVNPRWRESTNLEYAYVDCLPGVDGQGTRLTKIAYCSRHPPESLWNCTTHQSIVETNLPGYADPISIRYMYSSLPQVLKVVSYALSLPEIGGINPRQFVAFDINVVGGNGYFQVSGTAADYTRYIFSFMQNQPKDEEPFRLDRLSKCRGDVCTVGALPSD